MAFFEFKFESKSLRLNVETYVITPQKTTDGEIGVTTKTGGKKYKCLYLLHGLSDDHTIWLRRTSIERYASEYGLCVVMPCAHRSFYADMEYGLKYYEFISKELPITISNYFNVSTAREDNYVAGLSMGGYGALKLGLRETNFFSKAAGLSSCTDITRVNKFGTAAAIFGDKPIPDDDDLFKLAIKNKDNPNRPKLFMAVGLQDFLYDENIRFRDHLLSLGYDLKYMESEGSHTWEFWDKYIQEVLKWIFQE